MYDCPWCGESNEEMMAASGLNDPGAALEAHVNECEPAMRELGMLE